MYPNYLIETLVDCRSLGGMHGHRYWTARLFDYVVGGGGYSAALLAD
jgi:hypothetical protein